GADPESAIAKEIKAEVRETIGSGNARLVCPRCRSTEGFTTFSQPDTPPITFWWIALIFQFFGSAEVQCVNGRFIFEPPSRLRGCGIVLAALVITALIVLWGYLRR